MLIGLGAASVGLQAYAWQISEQDSLSPAAMGRISNIRANADRQLSQSLRYSMGAQGSLTTPATFDAGSKKACEKHLYPNVMHFDIWNSQLSEVVFFRLLSDEELKSLSAGSAQQQWQSLRPVIMERCLDYVRQVAYPQQYQALLETVRREEERLEQEREQNLAEQAAYEEKRNTEAAAAAAIEETTRRAMQDQDRRIDAAWRASGIASSDRILWATMSTSPKRTKDINELFNSINLEFENARGTAAEASPFIPPSKGEFEKTSDHQARVQREKLAYEQRQRNATEQANSGYPRRRGEILNEYLGVPRVEAVSYDADKELFTVIVGSDSSPFEITGVVKCAVARAPMVKLQLEKAAPNVLIAMIGDQPRPLAFVLRTIEGAWGGSVVASPKAPITFGPAAAQAWRVVLREEEQKSAAESRRAAAEAARNEQRRKQERLAKYGQAGPFLRKGGVVCTELRSIYRTQAIERAANPYLAQADDCLESPSELVALSRVDHMAGGLAKIVFKENGIAAYSMSKYIEE